MAEARPRRTRLGNEDPDETVLLLAGIAAGVDAVNLHVLIRSQGRDQLALAGMGVEPPAMVAALQLLAVEPAAGEWHTAMRAGIVQGEGRPWLIAAEDQGNFEQRGLVQLVRG